MPVHKPSRFALALLAAAAALLLAGVVLYRLAGASLTGPGQTGADNAVPASPPPPVDLAALRGRIQSLPPAPVPDDIWRETAPRDPARPRVWRHIVIHHTATAGGSPAAIDRYHRVERKYPNGLAYHFLIGNGNGFGDGEIHASQRWREQLQGGHVRGEELNEVAIGVCLVGDFSVAAPTDRQIAALKGLLRELLRRTGLPPPAIAGHNALPGQKSLCPGANFPVDTFVAALD